MKVYKNNPIIDILRGVEHVQNILENFNFLTLLNFKNSIATGKNFKVIKHFLL